MLSLEWVSSLIERYPQDDQSPIQDFIVGPEQLRLGSAARIMGVINLSAQSWYRESVCLTQEAAIRRGKLLAAQGADLVDIGGESTLAHAERISPESQVDLLMPIIKELTRNRIPGSVETYSAKVAEAAVNSGASVINMTGTQDSEQISAIAAQANAAVIISYVQGQNPREVDSLQFPSDPFETFREYFQREIDRAASQSLNDVVIDPGLGFYYRNLADGQERVRYQMETLLQTFRLARLGKPICNALPHAFEFFESDVRSAEPFFAVLAALGKTNLFRTHEVSQVKAVLSTLSCSQPSSPPE